MSDLTNRLRDRRANVWEQAKELADRAAEENRSFSGEEQRQWDEMNSELDALDARIKSVLEGEQRAKETEEQFDRIHGSRRSDRQPQPAGGRGGERRQDGGGEHDNLGSELRAFLRGESGRTFTIMPQPGEQRALVTSSASAASGGFTIPTTFYDRLIEHLVQTSGVMQAGPTVLNTAGGEVVQIPKTTSHYSATIVSEASAIGVSESQFGQVSLGAFKYGALFQISRELLDDTGVDLEGYLSRNAGRALGNAMGAHFITGTGSGQPRGIVLGATGAVTGATGVAGKPTADNLIDLYYSVISPYRASPSCGWLMADTTIANIRKLADSTGQYLWQPSLQVGAPDMLLGKPVHTDPYVAAVGTSAKPILFGDFSQYFIRLAGGVRFERSDEYSFDKDLVTFRTLLRADGALVDLTGAIKWYQGAAT